MYVKQRELISPGDQILNCVFFLSARLITFTCVRNDIPAHIFNFTYVGEIRVREVQQQFDIAVVTPPFKERSTVLDHSVRMCPFHTELIDALLVLYDGRLFTEIHSRSISSTKVRFVSKANPTSARSVSFVFAEAELIAVMAHVILRKQPYISHFVGALAKFT